MPLWAKIDVEMPVDLKLFGQPVATRWLWLCLITLAKQQDDAGAVRGYDCSLLSSRYNLPRKGVADALTYFQKARMAELEVDGTIRLVNFTKRQGEVTADAKRAAWRDRQQRHRSLSRVTEKTELEEEVELEKEKEDQRGATAPAQPSLAELQSGWPEELLERVRLAVTSTRKSGQMAEGPWRAFLLRAQQFAPAIRVRASETYLDGALAAEGKDERYLLGIMGGENKRLQQPMPLNGARRGAVLAISDEAKREHEIPGRKRVGTP